MSTRILRTQFLAIVFAGLLMTIQPKFAVAQDDGALKGFYVKMETWFAISSKVDETPVGAKYNGSGGPPGEFDELILVDRNNDLTGRIAMGYQMGNLDFGLRYSGLQVTGDNPNAGLFPFYTGGITSGNLYTPLIGNGLPASLATISYYLVGNQRDESTSETTYHVVDFEAGYTLNMGSTEVRALGGIRYTNFEENTSTSGALGAAFSIGTFPIAIGLSSKFTRDVYAWGVGPRIGLEASHPLARNFSVTGSVSGSALFGNRKTVDRTYLTKAVKFSRAIEDDFNVIGNLEADLGISYMAEMGNAGSLVFSLGWRTEAWLSVNNTSSSFGTLLGGTEPNQYGETDANQLFHGPYIRAAMHF